MLPPPKLNLLDIVALKNDLPQHQLLAGQVGTIVEILAPEVYEVEFSDDDGQTYATQALPNHQLLKLHYKPIANMTDFANNVMEIGSKLGIELIKHQTIILLTLRWRCRTGIFR